MSGHSAGGGKGGAAGGVTRAKKARSGRINRAALNLQSSMNRGCCFLPVSRPPAARPGSSWLRLALSCSRPRPSSSCSTYRYGIDVVTLIAFRMLFAMPFFAAAWHQSRLAARGEIVVMTLKERASRSACWGLLGYYLSSFPRFPRLALTSYRCAWNG